MQVTSKTTIQEILNGSELTPQEKVNSLKSLAEAALCEAEILVEEHDCRLSFELTYGAGAVYSQDWNSSGCYEQTYEWQASSQSC